MAPRLHWGAPYVVRGNLTPTPAEETHLHRPLTHHTTINETRVNKLYCSRWLEVTGGKMEYINRADKPTVRLDKTATTPTITKQPLTYNILKRHYYTDVNTLPCPRIKGLQKPPFSSSNITLQLPRVAIVRPPAPILKLHTPRNVLLNDVQQKPPQPRTSPPGPNGGRTPLPSPFLTSMYP